MAYLSDGYGVRGASGRPTAAGAQESGEPGVGIRGEYYPGFSPSLIPPEKVKSMLDEYVVGQEQAKRTIASISWNIQLLKEGLPVPRVNLLMTGPSGAGKTHLMQSLAKILNVPSASADGSCLTRAGYYGEDVEAVLERLLAVVSKEDKEIRSDHGYMMPCGIVFIDEFDKLLLDRGERCSHSSAVQAQFLRMMEGAEVDLGSRDDDEGEKKPVIDTSRIVFVFAGSFSLIKKGKTKGAIGFGGDIGGDDTEDLSPLTQGDFLEVGVIPEFMGRITKMVRLDELTKGDYVKILRDIKGSVIENYTRLLEYNHVQLMVDELVYGFLAEEAIRRGMGARGLSRSIEEVFEEIRYKVPSDHSIRECRVRLKEGKLIYEFVREGERPSVPVEESTQGEDGDGLLDDESWRIAFE